LNNKLFTMKKYICYLFFVLLAICGCDESDGPYRGNNPPPPDGANDRSDKDPEPQDLSSYCYELPLSIHVIETPASKPIAESRLEDIIDSVNSLYRKNGMNLKFFISRIKYAYSDKPSISCTLLMESPKGSRYYEMMEDPNKVINIYVYPFLEKGVLGISHFPVTTAEHPLEGLDEVNSATIRASQLDYIYCVSVNSDYLYVGTFLYNPNDAITTLAHELGHYLGLYHTFSEDDYGTIDDCVDSDYCTDTPTYNKEEYDRWLDALDYREEYTLEYLSQRCNCEGEEFISSNILDYAYSLSDEFSDEQRARVRHVLNYSPLIPGPKAGSTTPTRSVGMEGDTLRLPRFRAIPCPQASNSDRRLLKEKSQ